MARHYLDHASTSPLRPMARDTMIDYLTDVSGGDPGRIHAEGLTVRAQLEDARETIAAFIGARPREVVFTSSATEAIAHATWGAVERGHHVVMSAVEHSAVRRSAEQFARAVTVVGCDATGRIDPDEMMAAIGPDTSLVHVQWINHEVGTVQPVAEIIEQCRERNVLVHVDATQAMGRTPIDWTSLGADMMSVSAHKHGGPTGIGALLIRRGLRLRSLLVGADQERARRAGLEHTVAAVGWAGALAAVDVQAEQREQHWHSERVRAILAAVDGVSVFGPSTKRASHIVCCGIDGIEPQGVLLGLDQHGIAVHSGSACASEDLLPSPVLEAMGLDAHRSLRISVGWSTTNDDIDAFELWFAPVVAALRALR
jgi:cysteine desulfurase